MGGVTGCLSRGETHILVLDRISSCVGVIKPFERRCFAQSDPGTTGMHWWRFGDECRDYSLYRIVVLILIIYLGHLSK